MLNTRTIHTSDMTLTFDLEIWFKVTTYHLSKDTLWVKFEPEKAKGRDDILQRRDLNQTHKKTHILIIIDCMKSRALFYILHL